MSEKYRIVLHDDTMMDKQFYVSKDSSMKQIQWTNIPKNATTFGSIELAKKVRASLLEIRTSVHADECSIEIEDISDSKHFTEPTEIEETKQPEKNLEWSSRINIFGISFDLAKSDQGMKYRYKDENGLVHPESSNGKEVAKSFCSRLYGYLCVCIDRFEQVEKGQ